VISAARAFCPNESPSQAPAAIASTFLIAPPASTPVMSALSYARSVAPRRRAASARANAPSVEATTSAVGKPSATSSAKLGPETAPTGAGHRGASS
jgi:hypothetical protein